MKSTYEGLIVKTNEPSHATRVIVEADSIDEAVTLVCAQKPSDYHLGWVTPRD